MPQVIFTPQSCYKWMRNLIIGHTGSGGTEPDDFYISRNIGTAAVKKLAYFKVGTGGPAAGEITRTFFDTGAGAATQDPLHLPVSPGVGCKDKPSSSNTLGDLNIPIKIYGSGIGYGGSMYKKALVAANFYNYGVTVDSKVLGTLPVVGGASGKWWDIPGVAFQVALHLTQAEGNFYADGTAVSSPSVVQINEFGVFDEDDAMILYGTFDQTPKNNTLSFKANAVAMLKALDYQLVVTP